MTITDSELDPVTTLLSPEAVRERCGQLWQAGLAGTLDHFTVDLGELGATADYVVATIRDNYPDLEIPYHARWRHFTLDGEDLWRTPFAQLAEGSAERARARFDLAVISVLLDAGAGDRWRYRREAGGRVLARSEGLALASLDAFVSGLFSSDPAQPLRADAQALRALGPDDLSRAFQVSADNPLVGIEGRADLLNSLGDALTDREDHLFDRLAGKARNGTLQAREILVAVLVGLASIWPGRIVLDGVNLGDTWHHPAARGLGATSGLVPFHKLSQWLSYSLVEPLEEAGIEVTGLDDLTGLAEYRNGGLMLDCGLIAPARDGIVGATFAPSDEVIVEWRALTVAALDALAAPVREQLDRDAATLPLASILEGGTWAAGRRIAAERRPGGVPPIAIESDGSVF